MKTANILERQIREAKGELITDYYDHSSLIIQDPNTGEILAMASNPDYEPQSWVGGIRVAEYNKINLTVNISDETFLASGKVCLSRGFLEVLKPEKESKENNVSTKECGYVESTGENEEETENNLEILNQNMIQLPSEG